MKTAFRIALSTIVLASSALAHADGEKVPRAVSQPKPASAPASAPTRHATPGNRQHQLLGKCTQQVDAAGLRGVARKRALSDCMRGS